MNRLVSKYTLKPGYAYVREDGQWEVAMVSEETCRIAQAALREEIDGARCITFRVERPDGRVEQWAQTEVAAARPPLPDPVLTQREGRRA